jgi:hypothetical protein
MEMKDIDKDTEFLWKVFENTGLIGVYLMYEERGKQTGYKNIRDEVIRGRNGKRIREFN